MSTVIESARWWIEEAERYTRRDLPGLAKTAWTIAVETANQVDSDLDRYDAYMGLARLLCARHEPEALAAYLLAHNIQGHPQPLCEMSTYAKSRGWDVLARNLLALAHSVKDDV